MIQRMPSLLTRTRTRTGRRLTFCMHSTRPSSVPQAAAVRSNVPRSRHLWHTNMRTCLPACPHARTHVPVLVIATVLEVHKTAPSLLLYLSCPYPCLFLPSFPTSFLVLSLPPSPLASFLSSFPVAPFAFPCALAIPRCLRITRVRALGVGVVRILRRKELLVVGRP